MTRKTKELIEAIKKAAKNPSKNKLHIIPSNTRRVTNTKWRVVPDDSDRAIKVFEEKEKAISFAKKYHDTNEVEVHKSDGTTGSIITIR